MTLSFIRRIYSRVVGDKGRGSGYRQAEFNVRPLPKPTTGQRRKRNFKRLRSILQLRRRVQQEKYGSKVSRQRIYIRGFLAASAVTVVSLVVIAGGGKMLEKKLQSISFFYVSEIVFAGNASVSADKLREASGVIPHQTSMVGLDTKEIEKRLLQIPLIHEASVQRDLPFTLKISVVENEPLAMITNGNKDDNHLSYIDKNGLPFLSVKPGDDVDFPVITGLADIADKQLRDDALAEVLVFLKRVQGNDPYLPAQSVSEIHVDLEGNMIVYLVDYPFPIYFGNGNTRSKYSRLVQVLKALYKKHNGRELISDVEYIQMDYLQDKVLVAQNGSG